MFDFLNLTDAYKLDHRRQYPPGTTGVYSNMTPRSTRIEGNTHVTFVGLQYFLREYLMNQAQDTFFACAPSRKIKEHANLVKRLLNLQEFDTQHLQDLWDLGYLPLEFRALPEGTRVPYRVPMFTVESTHKDFFWLTNYIETLLSSVIWPMCTSATKAARYYDLLSQYSPKEFVPWQGHDFSFRGMMGPEAAALSGTGHLVYFDGTDCLPAMELIETHYNGLVGGSVPATEHSVMCAGGMEDELQTYSRLLDLYPTGLLSVVSDTWDLWNVLTVILPKLKDKIMAREGKLVIRPDSGDPVKILCGYCPSYHVEGYDIRETPAELGVVELLWRLFGGTETAEGRVLDPHVGAIYGDSITEERAHAICMELIGCGFSPSNVVFGIGSYTYQYTTRDAHGFAIKATWTRQDGVERMLQKDPVTDTSGKKSARGRLAVVRRDGELKLLDGLDLYQQAMTQGDLLQPVWRDGEFVKRITWKEVRNNARGEA